MPRMPSSTPGAVYQQIRKVRKNHSARRPTRLCARLPVLWQPIGIPVTQTMVLLLTPALEDDQQSLDAGLAESCCEVLKTQSSTK